MGDGSWVGLDVHARSVVAAVIDEVSGEVVVARAPVGVDELVAWVRSHRGPVRVAYEAGPTGFGLSRAFEAAGVGCVVAAPSLIPRSVAGRAASVTRLTLSCWQGRCVVVSSSRSGCRTCVMRLRGIWCAHGRTPVAI